MATEFQIKKEIGIASCSFSENMLNYCSSEYWEGHFQSSFLKYWDPFESTSCWLVNHGLELCCRKYSNSHHMVGIVDTWSEEQIRYCYIASWMLGWMVMGWHCMVCMLGYYACYCMGWINYWLLWFKFVEFLLMELRIKKSWKLFQLNQLLSVDFAGKLKPWLAFESQGSS